MKKVLYSLLAISMAAFSCTKESDINNNENNQNEEVSGIVSDAIPTTITGVLTEKTKTAYSDNGDFTWVDGDQIRLIVTQDLSTYSPQGFYTYRIKSLSGDKKTATFTSTGSAGDLTDFDNSGTYKSTGYAVYPISVLDRFSSPESHSYGAPWFTLARNSVSGAMSDIMLIGVNDASLSNFKFYTAMSVLRVTLKNIPANAAAVKLCTSDKTNYPIDGDFAISTGADGKPVLTFLSTWVSDFKGYQKVDVSGQGEIASADYYFNIPAATYPANTLSILVEDANGGQILKRTINAALTLERNDCLAMPAISYSHTIAFKANCTASAPVITWKIDSKRVRLCVSQNADININEFNNGYTFANDNLTGAYSGEYALSSFTNQRPSATGKYYMHYILQSDRGDKPESLTASNVVAYGTIPFYYISSDDVTAFAKQYTFNKTDNDNFWHPGTGSNYATTMTLAVSNDVTKGNLMISELYGKSFTNKKLYGVLTASNATSMEFEYAGDSHENYQFEGNGNYFHVAQGTTHTANVSGNITFNITAGPKLTCENYLMMKYTNSNSNYMTWSEFISGVGLIFN